MINGYFGPDGEPLLSAVVRLRDFGHLAEVLFLVSTGTDRTVICPRDAQALGVDFARLETDSCHSAYGRRFRCRPATADLSFRDANRPRNIERTLEILIAEPSDANREMNSVLGMDAIRDWRMEYARPRGILRFTPLSPTPSERSQT